MKPLKPFGYIVEYVDQWNIFYLMMNNMRVIQRRSTCGVASMGLRGRKWQIELGT